MPLDAELFRALSALTFGIASLPFSILFFTMFVSGRVITEEQDRSPLGTKAGWFFFSVGVVFLIVSGLTIATWHDLHPDRGWPDWITATLNVTGVVCIIVGMGLAIQIGPILLKYIRVVWKLEREGHL